MAWWSLRQTLMTFEREAGLPTADEWRGGRFDDNKGTIVVPFSGPTADDGRGGRCDGGEISALPEPLPFSHNWGTKRPRTDGMMDEPHDDSDSDDDEYTPTPEEIQRAAQAIRESWTETQAYFRRTYEPEPVDCPPEVRAMAEQRVQDRNLRRRMFAAANPRK